LNRDTVIRLEIGNVGIHVLLNGFRHAGYKAGEEMHSHASYELHVLLNGSAILETDSACVPLHADDNVIVVPDVFHDFKEQEKGSSIVSFTFTVNMGRKKGCADYSRVIERLTQQNENIMVANHPGISELVRKIMANMYSEHMFAYEKVRAALYMLFAELFSQIIEEDGTHTAYESFAVEQDTRIYMMEEYFNEYYMEDISLKKLAELLYLSEKQTERMVQKAFGEGFRARLTRVRLMSAKKLLKETDLEIQEIVRRVGYQSYNGFYMAFKKRENCTPQEYRDKEKKSV